MNTQPAPNASLAEGFAQVGALFAGDDGDLDRIYREHRANKPVMQGDICAELGSASFAGHTGRPIYTIFKHADVMKVLRDTKTFTSGILMETGLGPFLDGLMITGLDGDEHRQRQPHLPQELLGIRGRRYRGHGLDDPAAGYRAAIAAARAPSRGR